jgi:Amt family ammonium transporter
VRRCCGWAGSASTPARRWKPTAFAALAFINTFGATAAAVLAWCGIEALLRARPRCWAPPRAPWRAWSPSPRPAGNVGVGGALAIGLIAGVVCLWGVTGLKKLLGADDSLDVFGVHGVGGIVGALLTGVFNSPALGGPGYVADWVTAGMVARGLQHRPRSSSPRPRRSA